jgi:hypothetical protein
VYDIFTLPSKPVGNQVIKEIFSPFKIIKNIYFRILRPVLSFYGLIGEKYLKKLFVFCLNIYTRHGDIIQYVEKFFKKPLEKPPSFIRNSVIMAKKRNN